MTLNIQRWNLEIHAARSGEEAAGELRGRLEEVAREVGRALESALGADSGIYFLLRLDVPEAASLDGLGQAIAGAILRELATGETDRVVRFRDATDHLARFVMDTASGIAAEKAWCYEAFAGVRILPAPAAIRTVLTRSVSEGIAALGRLDAGQWHLLTRTLGAGELRRLLEALAAGEPDVAPETAVRAVLALLERGTPFPRTEDEGTLLRLFVDAPRGGRTLLLALRLMLTLRRAVREASTDVPSEFLAALPQEQAAFWQACPSEVQEPFLAAARSLAQPAPQSRTSSSGLSGDEPRFSSFGGALLLLPLVLIAPLGEGEEGRLARFLLLCRCLGGERAEAAFYDPLLRELCGVPPEANLAEAHSLAPRRWRHWRHWRQRERGGGGEWVRLQAGGIRVLCEGERGEWLTVRPVGEGGEPQVRVGSVRPELEFLMTRFPDDIAYLKAPSLGLPEPLESQAILAAQNVLRAVAYRIPGFGYSSLPYLYANFLEMSVALTVQGERRIALLSRPPLHLVLGMTGLASATFSPEHSRDARPITLRLGGD